MQGYDVITSDDRKVGHVVGKDGHLLIVERGTIRKARYAVPDAIATTVPAENVVRLTVSKDVFVEGPKADGGDIAGPVAEYYGFVGAQAEPDTQGYGEVTPQDPARGAEQEGRLAGVEPADEQRARMRESMRPEEGAPHGARGIHQDYWQVKK